MEQTKPVAVLVGQDGNVFNLMGIAERSLRNAGQADLAKEMSQRIWDEAESYEAALCIIGEYVEIR